MNKQQFEALVSMISLQTEMILTLIDDAEERFEFRRRHGLLVAQLQDIEFLTPEEIIERNQMTERDRLEARRDIIKRRAYSNDPDCWKSYSSKPAIERRLIDARRLKSLNDAERELIETRVISGG